MFSARLCLSGYVEYVGFGLYIDHRFALNGYLRGMSRSEFEAQQMYDLDHLQYGVELRDLARKRTARQPFDVVRSSASDPAGAIASYQVRYLAMPANTPKPAVLGPDWLLLQNGPAWQVWEHRPEPDKLNSTGFLTNIGS